MRETQSMTQASAPSNSDRAIGVTKSPAGALIRATAAAPLRSLRNCAYKDDLVRACLRCGSLWLQNIRTRTRCAFSAHNIIKTDRAE